MIVEIHTAMGTIAFGQQIEHQHVARRQLCSRDVSQRVRDGDVAGFVLDFTTNTSWEL